MKRLIFLMIVIFSPIVYAQSQPLFQENGMSCFLKIQVPSYGKIFGFSVLMPERSGCCSWHSGVCGCSGGRSLCCDGSLSPTCGC